MFGSMDTVQKIIAVHYSTYIRFLYSFPKGRKINLYEEDEPETADIITVNG